MRQIYFDNAATSFPKPEKVIQEMTHCLKDIGANPGRGGYRLSLEAGRIIFNARYKIKELFNAPAEENLVFTPNVSFALNMVIKGILESGDVVVTTSMEHNSVMRPLKFLEKTQGIKVHIVKGDSKGNIRAQDIQKALTDLKPKMLIMNHASNVGGNILPVEEISKSIQDFDTYFVIDTAQTAGTLDIDFIKLNLDALAFTGHKGLYGPQGTGGVILGNRLAKELVPLIQGGTGSRSDLMEQPGFLPDKFEAGTLNTPGIAGLTAGIDFVMEHKGRIYEHEMKLTKRFLEGLSNIHGIKVLGPRTIDKRVSTVSIKVKNMDLGELSYVLDSQYGIMVRSGLHCAPVAHKTLGSFPEGSLRFSFGYYNTLEEIDYCLEVLEQIIKDWKW